MWVSYRLIRIKLLISRFPEIFLLGPNFQGGQMPVSPPADAHENYWFAIGVPGNVRNYVRCLAVYLLQHKVAQMLRNVLSKKRGAKKIYSWVFLGKCLQDKYQRYNFIGEDRKANCAKTWKLVQNVKSVTTSTFESKFVPRIGFIVKAWCSMSSVGSIHYNKYDEMFRYKNDRHHFVGLFTSSATLGIQIRSFAFYAR